MQNAVSQLGVALTEAQRANRVPTENPELTHAEAVTEAYALTYEALEWAHSLNEQYRSMGRYENASDIDGVNGPFVEGAIGARNASHHGVRRVIGVAWIPPTVYTISEGAWILASPETSDAVAGQLDSIVFPSVRWLEELPDPPLKWTNQQAAFDDHLAGRDVRATFHHVTDFFLNTVDGRPMNLYRSGPEIHPPPIAFRTR